MRQNGHPSKQTFQAIRIECNQELEVLKKALDELIDLLHPGGRFCIITFHSLEDRIVKTFFNENSGKKRAVSRYMPELPQNSDALLAECSKAIAPTEEEIIRNPRSRSAKLRVAVNR